MEMEEEKFFKCPYCRERISMVLDVSESGTQTYIEDCQVCCRPIEITYTAQSGRLVTFRSQSL